MSGLSSSPRLNKGTLVTVDSYSTLTNSVVFQYNPSTMTRSLATSIAGDNSDLGEALRLSGPPKETITLSIELDATDQLEWGNPITGLLGIYPGLSALELMLYPKLEEVLVNKALAQKGSIEILPIKAPFILFYWGPQRILPVRITSFSITEELYDPLLNPIQAKVELSLTVLTYQDFSVSHPGHAFFMAHQKIKEKVARLNVVNNALNIVTGLVR